MNDLDPKRSMYRPVSVAHSSFIEGSRTTKNTVSGHSDDRHWINRLVLAMQV
jgi:hypothetical protein